jgi:hypothetical protein
MICASQIKVWIVGNPEVVFGRFLAESQMGVEKSASHHVSQGEIGSDNPCSRQLSGMPQCLVSCRMSGPALWWNETDCELTERFNGLSQPLVGILPPLDIPKVKFG